MSTSVLTRSDDATLEVQLLSQSNPLRIAVRRALARAGTGATLADPHARPAGAPIESARSAVIFDADMPGVSGVALLERISQTSPDTPIVVVAMESARSRSLRAGALDAGAAGFFVRPESEQPFKLRDVADEIVAALTKPLARRPNKDRTPSETRSKSKPPTSPRRRRVEPQILVIGSSTGGPQALIALFEKLSPDQVNMPVLIVQHMPASFTSILAEHIRRSTKWIAKEATAGERLSPGEIRIAPGGFHLVVAGKGLNRTLDLNEDAPVNFCRPSADVLFFSAVEHFGAGAFAVILTGMGHDGAQGAQAIKAAGGRVFVQDKETSVVWGMPGAAVAAGVVDKVLPLKEMGQAVGMVTGGVGKC